MQLGLIHMIEAPQIGPSPIGQQAACGGACDFKSSLSYDVLNRMGFDKAVKVQARDLATGESELGNVEPIGLYTLAVQKSQFRDKVSGEIRNEMTLVSGDSNGESIGVWTDAGEHGTGTREEYTKVINLAHSLAETIGPATMIWFSEGKSDGDNKPEHRVYVWKKQDDGTVEAAAYQISGSNESFQKMFQVMEQKYQAGGVSNVQGILVRGTEHSITHRDVFQAYTSSLTSQELKIHKNYISRFQQEVESVSDNTRWDRLNRRTEFFEKKLREGYKDDIKAVVESYAQGFISRITDVSVRIPEHHAAKISLANVVESLPEPKAKNETAVVRQPDPKVKSTKSESQIFIGNKDIRLPLAAFAYMIAIINQGEDVSKPVQNEKKPVSELKKHVTGIEKSGSEYLPKEIVVSAKREFMQGVKEFFLEAKIHRFLESVVPKPEAKKEPSPILIHRSLSEHIPLKKVSKSSDELIEVINFVVQVAQENKKNRGHTDSLPYKKLTQVIVPVSELNMRINSTDRTVTNDNIILLAKEESTVLFASDILALINGYQSEDSDQSKQPDGIMMQLSILLDAIQSADTPAELHPLLTALLIRKLVKVQELYHDILPEEIKSAFSDLLLFQPAANEQIAIFADAFKYLIVQLEITGLSFSDIDAEFIEKFLFDFIREEPNTDNQKDNSFLLPKIDKIFIKKEPNREIILRLFQDIIVKNSGLPADTEIPETVDEQLIQLFNFLLPELPVSHIENFFHNTSLTADMVMDMFEQLIKQISFTKTEMDILYRYIARYCRLTSRSTRRRRTDILVHTDWERIHSERNQLPNTKTMLLSDSKKKMRKPVKQSAVIFHYSY